MKRKVFCLTDASTPVLEQHGLVGLTLVLGEIALAPGACVEADVDEPWMAAQLEHVFATYHRGWDYKPRLAKVLEYFDAIEVGE